MTGDVHVVDYGHTNKAESNRVKKARTLARWLWDRNLTRDDVAAVPDPTLRAWARAAGVTPPSTMETWHATVTALGLLTAWADGNHGHPSAARTHADERPKWLTAYAAIPKGDAQAPRDSQLATVTALPTRQDGPVGDEPADPAPSTVTPLPVPAFAPRGWEACAALGPILRKDARCRLCGAPAVSATSREWRCAQHPPQPGQWGAALDFTPRDLSKGHPDTPHRCYQPRCPSFTLSTAPPETTTSDDRRGSRRR